MKTAADTLVCTLLERLSATVLIIEPLPIIIDYKQRYISSGSETASDDSYKPLLMTFSVVVNLNLCLVYQIPS
jgi:hypothetical protein